MTRHIQCSGTCRYTGILFACILAAIMILPATAADANIEAELGDTLTLHGVSYIGSSVYLFLTGPDLPENGVTLTDVSQRADQGKFTQVDLSSNQEWSYRWDTSRIDNEIKAGTYLVYVTNEPVDKAHLGGLGSYKTLEVFLTDSGASRVSVSSGLSYTLNPEMHSSVAAPLLNLTTPSTAPTTLPATETPVITLSPAPRPTTKSALQLPGTLLAGILGAGCILLLKRK